VASFQRALVSLCCALVLVGAPAAADARDAARLQREVSVANVPSDCSVDVTDRLQAILDANRTDAVVRLEPRACYKVEGRLQVTDARNFTLDGRGATIRAFTADGEGHAPRGGPDAAPNPQLRSHLKFVRGQGITVVGVTVRGPHDHGRGYVVEYAFQHFVHLEGTKDVVILWNDAVDIYGDFVYVTHYREMVGDTWEYTPWEDVIVAGNHFEWNGRQGIAVTGTGRHLEVNGNTFVDVRRSALDIEPITSDLDIADIRLQENRYDNCRMGMAGNFVSSTGSETVVRDVLIRDNHRQCGSLAMYVVSENGSTVKRNWLVAGNIATAPQEGGRLLWFVGVQNLWLLGNRSPYIPCNFDEPGHVPRCPLNLRRVTGLVEAGNTFVDVS
jgi:hypothetical protein